MSICLSLHCRYKIYTDDDPLHFYIFFVCNPNIQGFTIITYKQSPPKLWNLR